MTKTRRNSLVSHEISSDMSRPTKQIPRIGNPNPSAENNFELNKFLGAWPWSHRLTKILKIQLLDRLKLLLMAKKLTASE